MSTSQLTISPETARQLVITRQHLNNTPRPTMLDVVRDLGCLQLDPISPVARSHQLVLWSRLGNYDLAELDKLLYEDRSLFEYWAHVASIVLTEDYPIHNYRMRGYPLGDSPWTKRVRDWLSEPGVAEMRDTLLRRFREDGPIPSRAFKDQSADFPTGSGWTSGRNVNRMIDYLWHTGKIMVAHRQGIQRFWDVSERCLPDWTPVDQLDADRVTHLAAQKAIRALGVATAGQIKEHYTRHRYYDLNRILDELEAENTIQQITVDGVSWNGNTYIHSDDLPLMDKIQSGGFSPRTSLLSPFDNLICDRKRTEQLFNFHFRIEIYVPKNKRQYGYYVLPILHGDRLIGRIDPKLDRKKKILDINAVYAEDNAPDDTKTVDCIRDTIHSLAEFVGANEVAFTNKVPPQWSGLVKS